MTFTDYIIKERGIDFLTTSLFDMDKNGIQYPIEEWFSDLYADYIMLQPEEEKHERKISVTKKELNSFLHDVDMGINSIKDGPNKASHRLYRFMGWIKD